ncbi:peptidase [Streptomyces sp. PRh5]|uniref:LAETG motif-containing sortase-dependent surface protein n=1 Tax=Streptomyces sp. PRh5 TaxID=1158056 RepID=UPI00044B235C|nr:LAETG motif-containing sortase-dependent surface protein [Streptomyces sp. PRh5]EXU69929.1 peptidase [Streptomyces sp. PRh5]
MISVRRRGAARLAAAVLASGLVAAGAIATAGTAAADDAPPSQGGATATLGGLKTFDKAIIHDNGKDQQVGAGLFEMSVDNGGSIQTYCIDLHNPTQSKAKYEEKSWAETSLANNPDAGKINWVLQNSYPQVNDLGALAKKAGIDGALTEKTAAAGTQVAIWRFSDKANVDAADPQAEKLADYLEKNAQNLQEPKASLSLDPPAVSGKAGERLGPVKVHTNADSVTLAPGTESAGGVKLVDKTGKTITSAADGGEVYFDVPEGAADGSATLTAQAATKVPVGRAFASATKSQTQILAGSSESTVSATATANWAKKGAVPAVSAEKDCAKGGVDITASNKGDEAFTFELLGQKYTVEAGQSKTVTAPVKEDQSYKFTISGPNGFEKTFSGVLDCKTSSSGGSSGDTPSSQPSPASAGGSTGGDTSGGDLAETGSSSNTPMIAGIAVALVVVGGGAIFFVRKKKATAGE